MESILSLHNLSPSEEENKILKAQEKEVREKIAGEIKKRKIKAQVFTGGSFAKGTSLKGKDYDIDVFVRFENKDSDKLSDTLERVLKSSCGKSFKIERVHGSRDYFKLNRDKLVTFEIVPVLKINKPKEAKNITDLSYFHVSYTKKKINDKLRQQIRITKAFLKANGLYGAESYINGISGYGVECLIIYYKTFEKMISAIAKSKGKVIIDIEKFYKNSSEILMELNESKTRSPIVLIDPTWKERNVLAALGDESFMRLQKLAREFIDKPSESFFVREEISEPKLLNLSKSNGCDIIKITLNSNKQPGDIAGTKMKKFFEFLKVETAKSFDICFDKFVYSGGDDSIAYLSAKTKKELIKKGPPLEMKEHAEAFRRQNSEVFVEKGIMFARIKIKAGLSDFIEKWKSSNKNKISQMDIIGLKIEKLG